MAKTAILVISHSTKLISRKICDRKLMHFIPHLYILKAPLSKNTSVKTCNIVTTIPLHSSTTLLFLLLQVLCTIGELKVIPDNFPLETEEITISNQDIRIIPPNG